MNISPLYGRRISLRLAEVDDASTVFDIRSDIERSAHLSTISTDVLAQTEWLRKYKDRELSGSEYYFIIRDGDQNDVGLVRIYDIADNSFSWGSWIIRPSAPSYCAIESALVVYDFAFGLLGLAHCHFEVRKRTARVWTFHERMGATRVSEDDIQYFYEISSASYYAARARYAKFLPSPGM